MGIPEDQRKGSHKNLFNEIIAKISITLGKM
jgi:hypothetical protein